MGKISQIIGSALAVVIIFCASSVMAETVTSPSYRIDGNLSGNFGGETSSTSYKMSAIGGESIVGNGASGSYIIDQQYNAAIPSMQLGVQPNGLVGYYPLDEVAGTTMADASRYQNNGAFEGSPSWGTGKIGNALSLNGTNGQRVSVPDSGDITMTTKMTLSLWANQSAATANKALASHWNYAGGATSGGWGLQTESTASRLQFFVASSPTDVGSNYIATDAGTWASGGWHHIVVVYDGTLSTASERVSVYIDNVKVVTSMAGTIPATMQNAASPMMIGDFNGLNRTWNGSIDHVKLFNRALTTAEVKAEYTAQNAGIPTGFGLEPTPGTSITSDLDAIVRTNANYTVSVQQDNDLQNGGNYIPAVGGSIASPATWSEGATKGLGFTLTSAPILDGKWNSGAKYAAIPSSATTFYSSAGYGTVDVLSLRLRLDVTTTQIAGVYSNAVTYTGTTTP